MATRRIKKREKHPKFKSRDMITGSPPYDFKGVTLRYFPLKANLQSLKSFCDEYLNLAPDLAYFRPAMPYALLTIVNYGRMSQHLSNFGWMSQNELLFSLPIEWYRRERGRLVFHDYATVAPFIFVDNDSSQSSGREILGWPKVQGWFTRDVDAWARHPRNRREVLTLTTRVFERLYENQAAVPRELLVVEEEPNPTFTEMPADPGNVVNPFVSLPNAFVGWSQLAMRTWDTALRELPEFLRTGRSQLSQLADFAQSQDLLGEALHGNTINLKQMRDAGQTDVACYQAITNAQMEVARFHRGGMLGDAALLRGDTSGGFRIRLNRYESQPIVEVLGLEVDEELAQEDLKSAYIRPVMPFWQEMDLRYMTAENVCWRTSDLDWRNDERKTVPTSKREQEERHLYNTTGPAGLQVATGPFRFDNASFRVLPLLADKNKLADLVAESLPNGALRFEPYGRYVFLVISSFGQMYSESNDMGDWADKVVQFVVPVRGLGEDGALQTVGFFCPFMYDNSNIGVTTGREVYGWPVVEAQILNPRNRWLDEDGPFAELRPYLDMKAEVFPAVGVGQESEWRTLLEVDGGIAGQEKRNWQTAAEGWGTQIKKDVSRMAGATQSAQFKHLRALALEILGNTQPLNQFSLKQFRDAELPNRACYQALVRRPLQILRVHEIREIDDRMHVKIHNYQDHPIVERLGLVVQSTDLGERGRVDYLQPSRQFYMKLDLLADLPVNVCRRSLRGKWQAPDNPEHYYFSSGSALTDVGDDLVDFIDGRDSILSAHPVTQSVSGNHRIKRKCALWLDNVPEEMRLHRDTAKAAVNDDTLEPQMVFHTLLSNGWGSKAFDRADSPRSEVAPDPTDFRIRRDSVGDAVDELFAGEEAAGHSYWSPHKTD